MANDYRGTAVQLTALLIAVGQATQAALALTTAAIVLKAVAWIAAGALVELAARQLGRVLQS